MKFLKIIQFAPEYVSTKRMSVCGQCEFKKLNFCKICGCFLPFKVKFLRSNCPKRKWGNPTNTWGGW